MKGSSIDFLQSKWTIRYFLAKELGDAVASDTELCKICMDAIADCVFLDCGHMVNEKIWLILKIFLPFV